MPPKLLLFAACEKVIIDQNNVFSLISLLQELRIEIPEPPPDADGKTPIVPMKWDVVALWTKADADEREALYQTRFALIDPTGRPSEFEGTADLVFADKQNYRVVTTILGFPIRHEGRYVVRLWLHKKGEPKGEPVAEFPIILNRSRPQGLRAFPQPAQPSSRSPSAS